MNILVTGGTGFIGSHLVSSLVKDGKHNVVCLVRDLYRNNWLDYALADSNLVVGTVNDMQLLRRIIVNYNIEKVYHMAAQAIVSEAQKNPIEAYNSTVMGTVNLLEACRLQDVDQTVVLITDKIFGNVINAHEDDPYMPTGIYETSKVCQDAVCSSYSQTYDMSIARIRTCNQYGLDYNKRIIPNTIRACLSGQKPVIYSGENSKRQYMYVKDFVDVLQNWIIPNVSMNFGTDDFLTQEEVVRTIAKEFDGIEPEVIEREQQLELKENSLATTKVGWKPKYTFEQGIKDTIEQYRRFGW